MRECQRLTLVDFLSSPMQRITRYPLLLDAIAKVTQWLWREVGWLWREVGWMPTRPFHLSHHILAAAADVDHSSRCGKTRNRPRNNQAIRLKCMQISFFCDKRLAFHNKFLANTNSKI